MLKIHEKYVAQIHGCQTRDDLFPLIQKAIELEHATIPPYLTAMFSLRGDDNAEIETLIRSIVIEEMSHMTIACNLLISIGGQPQINTPALIPKYPGPLPMHIGGDDFIVPIKAFSRELVKDVFMEIEEPEHPIDVDTSAALLQAEAPFKTIGEFYEAIKKKIESLGNDIFVDDPEKQVTSWFNLFPIVDVDSAIRAIDIIVIEGEGTSSNPFEKAGVPAHYYRFGEIYYGKKLIQTDDGYAYGGEPIPFDPAAVWPMVDNPKIDDYPVGSKARILMERYAYSYSSMLNALHDAFNGKPEGINTAIGVMYELKLQALDLMKTVVGEDSNGDPVTAGPDYVYRETEGGVSSEAAVD